ncbi:MAG TPA: DUF885 domain-containing protein [Planctomycetota bacterium]|jgi:uncharacterized protein (DUF885 family)|nr:DUF885 domain-containing protein [Planctomycetota bacterium]
MARPRTLAAWSLVPAGSIALLAACQEFRREVGVQAKRTYATIEELLAVEPTRPAPGSVAEQRFDQVVAIYLDAIFRHDPVEATRSGFHGRDGELGDLSRETIAATVATLSRLYRDLDTIDPRDLTGDRRVDRGLLADRIKADRLELESIRRWETDPNYYLRRVSEGFHTLLVRDFAPAPTRAAAVVARAKAAPAVLEAGRRNLKSPPRVWTEVAIDQTKGAIAYLETEAAEAFVPGALEPDQEAAFDDALDRGRQALGAYLRFLEEELLPRSSGPFALGEERFRNKLFLEESVSIPLDRLLLIGEDEVERLQELLAQTAEKVAPGEGPKAALARIAAEHPAAEAVVPAAEAGLAELRRFCVEKRLVTFPGESRPTVRPTPPFARAYTFASMDSPGPLERVAREAFYSVTLPKPETPPARAEEELRFFNRYALLIVSAHEAFPGHFTQMERLRLHPSIVRRFLRSTSNVEGWAHYCEEVVVEEGFGGGDPRLRLAQLQLALVRACRYVVGIRLHTREMTLAEATRFFVEHAHVELAVAEREAKRGTSDPTYLAYTLGKKMILKLRDDWRQAKGGALDLGAFHDAFLSCGAPPLPVVRTLLLPGDAGPVL